MASLGLSMEGEPGALALGCPNVHIGLGLGVSSWLQEPVPLEGWPCLILVTF